MDQGENQRDGYFRNNVQGPLKSTEVVAVSRPELNKQKVGREELLGFYERG